MKKKNIQFVKAKKYHQKLINYIKNNKFDQKFYPYSIILPNSTHQWIDIEIPSRKNNKIVYAVELTTPNVKLLDRTYHNVFFENSDIERDNKLMKRSNYEEFKQEYDQLLNTELTIFENNYGKINKYSIYEHIKCIKLYKQYPFLYNLAAVIDTKFLTIYTINNWIEQFYALNEPLEYIDHLIDKNQLIFDVNWEDILKYDEKLINFSKINQINTNML